jgi:hypothetical protein
MKTANFTAAAQQKATEKKKRKEKNAFEIP